LNYNLVFEEAFDLWRDRKTARKQGL